MSLFQSPALRDLALYLRAGWFANIHLPVYLPAPMEYLPGDPTLLPFLYPPFTLPFFGFLAKLPWGFVAVGWVAACVGASVLALRLFGLSWRWSAALLLWPPFAEGIYVGNVAVPAVLLFAAGLRAGGGLPFAAIFKLQAGIPSLWLLRERRIREFAIGVGMMLLLAVGTLPIVGLNRWAEWFDGLLAFRDSEAAFPALAGQSVSLLVPTIAWLALVGGVVVLALRAPGREGLKRVGIAAIVGSPSLYSHGFLVGLPAFLSLNTFWFWVVAGCTASVWGYGWWAAVAIAIAAWRFPTMNHRVSPMEHLHPLRGAAQPWQRPVDWGGVGLPVPADRKAPSDVVASRFVRSGFEGWTRSRRR